MSAQEFIDYISMKPPEAYLLIANSIWERFEHEAIIALFDTRELAAAYMLASMLPTAIRTTERSWHLTRSYRPDSLLWDSNSFPAPSLVLAAATMPINPAVAPQRINPAPPMGPLTVDMFAHLHEDDVAVVASYGTLENFDLNAARGHAALTHRQAASFS